MCGEGSLQNLATFIRGSVVVQNLALAFILLVLERFMDSEFQCPLVDHHLAVAYSLSFILVPVLILLVVGHYFGSLDGSVPGCRDPCCKTCLCDYKAVLIWLLIVITNGRYLDCFVKSLSASANYCRKPLPACVPYDVASILQIIGLMLILLVISVIFCCQGCSKSARYRTIHKDTLLRVTEDVIHGKAKQKQREFVEGQLDGLGWAEFNVDRPDAQEELERIIIACKNIVKETLEPQSEAGRRKLVPDEPLQLHAPPPGSKPRPFE